MKRESGIQKIAGVKGTYYRVQIRMKGARNLSKSFDSYLEAKEWKTKTTAAIKSGLPYETTEMRRTTVTDLIERFTKNE